ncbi:hypothetical protein CARUB_v10002721mg, partial [Capsella rubella]
YITRLHHPLSSSPLSHQLSQDSTMTDDVVVNHIEIESERSIFLTFVRGIPVSKKEVTQLFTETYGENCVERVQMVNNIGGPGPCQSLYALLVVDSVATMNRILDGQQIKKLRINGRPIWVRKHGRRDVS